MGRNTGGTPIHDQFIEREQPKRVLGTPLEVIEKQYLPSNEQLWDKVRKR